MSGSERVNGVAQGGQPERSAVRRQRAEGESKNLKLLCVPRGSVRGKCGGEKAPTERRPPKCDLTDYAIGDTGGLAKSFFGGRVAEF